MKEILQKFFSKKQNIGISIGAVALIVVVAVTCILFPGFGAIDNKGNTNGDNIITPAIGNTDDNSANNNGTGTQIDNSNSQTPTVAPKNTDNNTPTIKTVETIKEGTKEVVNLSKVENNEPTVKNPTPVEPKQLKKLPTFKTTTELALFLKNAGFIADKVENQSGVVTKDATAVREESATGASGAAPVGTPAPTSNMATTDAKVATGESIVGTNNQIADIEEGDIVKTDGKNIYISANQKVFIVDAKFYDKKDNMQSINLPQNFNVNQMFIENGKLVILGNLWRQMEIMPLETSAGGGIVDSIVKTATAVVGKVAASVGATEPAIAVDVAVIDGKMIAPGYGGYNTKSYTTVLVYDVSDVTNIKLLRELSVEGNLTNSRMMNGKMYFATNTYINCYGVTATGDSDLNILLPTYKDTKISDEYVMIAPTEISYMPTIQSASYITVAILDIANDGELALETVLGDGYQMYMSYKNMYIARQSWTNNTTSSEIFKFDISGDAPVFKAMGRVEGYIESQFSFDEKDGYLRVATTEFDKGNHLFVLDENMEKVGAVQNLATGERIYSVRFMGDVAYVVTFKNMDPLFVIDLKDPKAPKVTGQLKIPGFSEYLHPLDANTLIGFGRETQEIYVKDEKGNESVVGNRQGGIKLSLFDVSDMSNPTEISHIIIGNETSYSEALYNHKAVFFDKDKNVFAFPMQYFDNEKQQQIDGAVAYTVSREGGFKLAANIAAATDPNTNYWTEKRMCAIGSTFYYVGNGGVTAYDYNTFNSIGTVTLK